MTKSQASLHMQSRADGLTGIVVRQHPRNFDDLLLVTLFLKVRDGAGNVTVVTLDFNSVLPTWLGYFGILVVLIALFIMIRFLKRHLVFTTHE